MFGFFFVLFFPKRQMVARSLLDTLRSVVDVEDDVATVLSVLLRLSEDIGSCNPTWSLLFFTTSIHHHIVKLSVLVFFFFVLSLFLCAEPSVRAELVEQVPHIAAFCQEHSTKGLEDVLPRYLLPLVMKYLADPNNQVRKTSQAALLSLLEQKLLKQGDRSIRNQNDEFLGGLEGLRRG